jgi:DNA-binding CsgD family transcriptional regulator
MIHRRAASLANDPAFREWWSDYLRMSASPGAAVAFSRMNWQIDIRHVLPAIRVPTLVLHRTGDTAMQVENGRYLAEHIPGARYVELPGDDHLPFTGDQDAVLDVVEPFLTGAVPSRQAHPVLATVMLTQIVEAMAIAARVGEQAWRPRLAGYQRIVREEVTRYRGREAGAPGASAMAVFDGPARALRCATAIVARARELDLSVRAALHTGEVALDGDVRGPACQVAVRVLERADPGGVAVSSTIVDLAAGSGIAFQPLGRQVAMDAGRRLDLFRVASVAPRPTPSAATPHSGVPLTPREVEVATLIGRGLSNRQIAETLSISVATVERHAANIFNKLDLHSRTQVAVWAAEHGLLIAGSR